MVDDTLRYHTREVIRCDWYGSSSSATSRTLHTDGFDVGSYGRGVWGRTATLIEATSTAAATCAALLTSGITARRGHTYLDDGLEGGRGKGFGRLRVK